MSQKRPFVYITSAFACGIFFGSLSGIPLFHSFILSSSFVALAITFSKNRILSHVNLYLALFFLGILFYRNSSILPVDHVSNFLAQKDEETALSGVVSDDPVIGESFYGREKTTFILDVSAIKKDGRWRGAKGLVMVYMYNEGRTFHYGDEVVLEGILSGPHSLKNPGLFDYSKYLAVKNIYAILKVAPNGLAETLKINRRNAITGFAYKLRHKIMKLLDRYLSADSSGFLKAILVGDRSALNRSIEDDFVKTGTVHILSVSGQHVGLLAVLSLAIFAFFRIPYKARIVSTALIVIFYALLAGSNPPIVRAAVMFFVFALGAVLGRRSDIFNSLAVAAFLLLAYNPKELFDPSFQLSFLSILAIAVLSPGIDGMVKLGQKGARSFWIKMKLYGLKGLSVSLAAWLGMAPIVAGYFNITSPIAIIANIVMIPVIFALFIAIVPFLILGAITPFMACWPACLLEVITKTLFFVNHRLAELPLACFRVPAPGALFLLAYYSTLALLFLPKIKIAKMEIGKREIFAAVLMIANIMVWDGIFHDGDKTLKVTFLDVGQGDSCLLQFPAGENILIDGSSGGEEEKFDIGKSVIAPYLWNQGIYRIDAVIVTHFHEDHLGGLIYILNNFKIGCVIENGIMAHGNKIYDKYRAVLKAKGIGRIIVGEGDLISDRSGTIKFFVLNPEKKEGLLDRNENSIVLKLVYGNSGILFCGDIPSTVMDRLISSYGNFLESDVMKVPHHGGFLGEEYSVERFFKKVDPKIMVISVGMLERYRAPLTKTLKIITNCGLISYETKNHGAVQIYISKNSITAKPFISK